MTDNEATLSPSFSIGVRELRSDEPNKPTEDERRPHVLICIHGIRDNGSWCNSVRTIDGFVQNKIQVVCASYSRLDSLSFAMGLRRKEIRDDIVDQINFIRKKYPESRISLFGHSNGSKIIAESINLIEFSFEWIFLCGSVCKLSDLKNLRNINRHPVNDVGTRDFWPLAAELINSHLYQATGSTGFFTFPVADRFYEYKHGGGVTIEHIENEIIPIIVNGRVDNVAKTETTSFWKKHGPSYVRRFIIFGFIVGFIGLCIYICSNIIHTLF